MMKTALGDHDHDDREDEDRRVPIPHFGLLLNADQFLDLADRLREAGPSFVIEPY